MKTSSSNFLCLVLLTFLLSNCTEPDEPTPDGPSGKDANPFLLGETVKVPLGGQTGGAINPKATNEGIYMTAVIASTLEVIVFRLQMEGPSPKWLKWEESHSRFHPSNPYSEQPDTFSALLVNGDDHDFCHVNLNSPLPAHLPGEVDFVIEDLLIDNSSSAYTWALSLEGGMANRIMVKGALPNFEQKAVLPKIVKFLEASPTKPEVYAAGKDVVYKIDIVGEVTTYDISQYISPDPNEFRGIHKIRFSGEDTFFIHSNMIFKIDSQNNLDLFHVIEDENGNKPIWSDFAVDDNHLFTNFGNVLTKRDGELVANIIPPGPSPSDTVAWNSYIEQLTIFIAGQMEVSTDMFGTYIYSLNGDKILISPKKRFPFQY